MDYVLYQNAADSVAGEGIILDVDGNILVTGYSWGGTGNDMFIWKYTSRGILDTSFGDDDPAVTDPSVKLGYTVHRNAAGGDGYDSGYGITLDADGNILVTGHSYGDFDDMVIWRYTTYGMLDTSFGDDDPADADPSVKLGYIVYNDAAGNVSDYGYGITLDGGGNILVLGYSHVTGYGMTIWRYTYEGILDNSFNGVGFIAYDRDAVGPYYYDYGYAITLDADGNILVTGLSGVNSDMTIWRYLMQ